MEKTFFRMPIDIVTALGTVETHGALVPARYARGRAARGRRVASRRRLQAERPSPTVTLKKVQVTRQRDKLCQS